MRTEVTACLDRMEDYAIGQVDKLLSAKPPTKKSTGYHDATRPLEEWVELLGKIDAVRCGRTEIPSHL